MVNYLPTIPTSEEAVAAASERARRHVARQALLSAGATLVPVPGVDMLVDVSVMIKMIDHINKEFGLTPEQIARLSGSERVLAYEAITWAGTLLAGKVVTSQLAVSVLKTVGVRMSAKQAARWMPVVGQATAAALGYAALKYLGEAHIRDCERIARQIIYRLCGPQAQKSEKSSHWSKH